MNFNFKESKNKKDAKQSEEMTVNIPLELLDEIISILSKVDCTCVWSPSDNQYIKVNDIPNNLVEELITIQSLKRLALFSKLKNK